MRLPCPAARMAICSDDCIRRELSHFCARLPAPASTGSDRRMRGCSMRKCRQSRGIRCGRPREEIPCSNDCCRPCSLSASLSLCRAAYAADACKNRGELDAMYCDENNDLVADAPADPKKWKNPSTIVFTYTPVEDPAVYENIFKPFTTALAKCLDKKVVFYQVQSNAAEIEAMRSGRLHVAGFSTGPTAFAVNLAGAVPFAVKGTAKEFQGYNLIVIVKANSPYQKLVGSERQEGRAHVAVVEFGTSRAARAVPGGRPRSRQGLQDHLFRQARPVGDGRQLGRLRRRRRRVRRVPPDGRARAGQGERFPHHLPQPEIPDLVVCVRARSRIPSSSTRC